MFHFSCAAKILAFFQIVDWLLMPPNVRPGLVTAYLDQPDSAGHYQIDDKDVSGFDSMNRDCRQQQHIEKFQIEHQLAILDTNLRYLIDRLDDNGLLGCINLVIVSDHGEPYIPFSWWNPFYA